VIRCVLSFPLGDGSSVAAVKGVPPSIRGWDSPRSLHLEHIAPQKATEGWAEALGAEGLAYEKKINQIGNITILDSGLNMQIKQAAFAAKQTEYEKSRNNVSNDLAKLKNWTSEMIGLRTDWVAESLTGLLGPEEKKVEAFSCWLQGRVG